MSMRGGLLSRKFFIDVPGMNGKISRLAMPTNAMILRFFQALERISDHAVCDDLDSWMLICRCPFLLLHASVIT
jgi:hypothetical protein